MNPLILKKSLTQKQAEAILSKDGFNELPDTHKYNFLTSFFSQFNNLLIILLLFAAFISLFLGETIDSFFIFIIVFLNALFGVYQEFKAEKALKHLKQMTITNVRVIRDRVEREIDSRYLVAGDIIYLEEGSKIPADAVLVDTSHFETNEASLTGESLPVAKDVSDPEKAVIFAGTIVTKGRGYARIVKTGINTKFGLIAKGLSQIKTRKTPLQKKLEVFTKQIGLLGTAACIIVFVLSFIKTQDLLYSFLFGVSLAVAAVPEGLPAAMTITLAIGVERMAKKKTLVRKLNAIEALGSVTLVATDKTGTLTTNQMMVKKIYFDNTLYQIDKVSSSDTFKKIILNSVLCSTASLVKKQNGHDVIGDTTEGALLLMAQENDHDYIKSRSEWQMIEEQPFDAVKKRMTVYLKNNNSQYIFSKGAPESILGICGSIKIKDKIVDLNKKDRNKIIDDYTGLAKQGYRLIGFSYKEKQLNKNRMEKDHIFLGFVAIADPIRAQVAMAVSTAKQAGIKIVMITGDSPETGLAIGTEAGIIKSEKEVIIGSELDKYTDEQLVKMLPQIKVFARTTPEHKYRLVKLYQHQGDVVAVTGDGVNDALALKQADIGIAMGITGTDVAKETAHIIITDDNFATIITAIEQGRNIFNHIKNVVKYLLACNIGEVIYIVTAVVFNFTILTPLQLLYINLATDGLPAIALAFAPGKADIMKQMPRKIKSILEANDYRYVVIVGILTAVLAYLTYLTNSYLYQGAVIITAVFTSVIIIQQFILIDLWLSHRFLLSNLDLLKKPMFIAGFIFPFILHPFLLYTPLLSNIFKITSLTMTQLLITVSISLLIFIPIELDKRKLI